MCCFVSYVTRLYGVRICWNTQSLLVASGAGHTDVVRMLLDSGALVDTVNVRGSFHPPYILTSITLTLIVKSNLLHNMVVVVQL